METKKDNFFDHQIGAKNERNLQPIDRKQKKQSKNKSKMPEEHLGMLSISDSFNQSDEKFAGKSVSYSVEEKDSYDNLRNGYFTYNSRNNNDNSYNESKSNNYIKNDSLQKRKKKDYNNFRDDSSLSGQDNDSISDDSFSNSKNHYNNYNNYNNASIMSESGSESESEEKNIHNKLSLIKKKNNFPSERLQSIKEYEDSPVFSRENHENKFNSKSIHNKNYIKISPLEDNDSSLDTDSILDDDAKYRRNKLQAKNSLKSLNRRRRHTLDSQDESMVSKNYIKLESMNDYSDNENFKINIQNKKQTKNDDNNFVVMDENNNIRNSPRTEDVSDVRAIGYYDNNNSSDNINKPSIKLNVNKKKFRQPKQVADSSDDEASISSATNNRGMIYPTVDSPIMEKKEIQNGDISRNDSFDNETTNSESIAKINNSIHSNNNNVKINKVSKKNLMKGKVVNNNETDIKPNIISNLDNNRPWNLELDSMYKPLLFLI